MPIKVTLDDIRSYLNHQTFTPVDIAVEMPLLYHSSQVNEDHVLTSRKIYLNERIKQHPNEGGSECIYEFLIVKSLRVLSSS